MTQLFLNTLNLSISAIWLVLAVLVARWLLKKAPKWADVALWGIVALRLLLPFSIESTLSLIPSAQTISPKIMLDTSPQITTGIDLLNNTINPMISESFAPNPGDSANPLQILIPVAACIWLAGMAVLLLYAAATYWHLRKRVDTAVRMQDNIFYSEFVTSPFVLGIVKPKIYLPYTLGEREVQHVIAHEQAHIRRRDHWWKPLGFLLLTIHWFNPVLWLAYWLLCRDIELACDEKVIRQLNGDARADYSQALLSCAVGHRNIAACPLAFGEVGVKTRVKSVLHYKKPAFWLILAAVVACIVLSVCFLTNPKPDVSELPPITNRTYTLEKVYYDSPVYSFTLKPGDDAPDFQIDGEMQLRSRGLLSQDWTNAGTLQEMTLTRENFDDLFLHSTGWFDHQSAARLRRQTVRAWSIIDEKGQLTYLLQTEEGSLFWAFGFCDILEKDDPHSDDSSIRWLFRLKTVVDGSPATKWYDIELIPGEDWTASQEITLDAFPGVTFRCNGLEVTAQEEGGVVQYLYSGMPTVNVYFADLTGDGKPELCSTTHYGSGMVDSRIQVYDYAAGKSYTLEDRGVYDYCLYEENGVLYVSKQEYRTDNVVRYGPLVLVNAGGGEGQRLEIAGEQEKT